jgi:hypothetical protein
MPSFDPRALGQLTGTALSAAAYRNQAKGFDPRSGDGARRLGGRFNPPHSFPVLYLCLTRPCVVAELTRQAERQGLNVEALLPRELFEIRADLDKVLTSPTPKPWTRSGSLRPTSRGRTTGSPRRSARPPTSTPSKPSARRPPPGSTTSWRSSPRSSRASSST